MILNFAQAPPKIFFKQQVNIEKLISNSKHSSRKISSFTLVLSFVILLIPVVALYVSKGIIILFALAVLFGLFVFVTKKESRSPYPQPFGFSVLALTLWCTTSLIWTISPDLSWTVAHSIPICMLGGILIITCLKTLSTNDKNYVCQSAVWGFFIGLSLALIDVSTDLAIKKILTIVTHEEELSITNLNNMTMRSFVINNGLSLLAMLFWPILIILHSQKRYKLGFLGFVSLVYVITKGSNFAATVAVGVGSISFLIAFFAQRVVFKITAIGLTLLILGAPFAMNALPDSRTIGKHLPELSYSVYPRLVIWQYASDLIMNKPLTGYGVRTSRSLSKTDKKISFLYRDKGEIHSGNTEAIPLHPHNGLIQIWLELGVGGALLGLLIVLSVLWGIKRSYSSKVAKAFALASLTSSICLISVSYGLWQSWWLASLWLQGSLVTLSLISCKNSKSL